MSERTILRKRCARCGGEAEIDVTDDLRMRTAADGTLIPGVPLTVLAAAPFRHEPVCPGDDEAAAALRARERRFVAALVVYEVRDEAEDPEWSDLLSGLDDRIEVLGGARAEAIAPSAPEAAVELAERLGERWQTLAGTLGLAEVEIETREGSDG